MLHIQVYVYYNEKGKLYFHAKARSFSIIVFIIYFIFVKIIICTCTWTVYVEKFDTYQWLWSRRSKEASMPFSFFLTNRFSQSGHISAKSVQIISTLIIKYYLLAMIVSVNMIHTCMKCTSKNQIYPTNSSGMTATPKSANSSIKFSSSLCEIALQKQRLQI